jgi:EAL domain-containing protein (putative c-di-GMP-specific phosphodiesterase class I)
MEETYSHLNADWLVEGVLCRVDCVIAFLRGSRRSGVFAGNTLLSEICHIEGDKYGESRHRPLRGRPDRRVRGRQRIAAQLKEAIKSGAFSLYFEPICKIGGDQRIIIGADCGIGFQFAQANPIPTNRFLPWRNGTICSAPSTSCCSSAHAHSSTGSSSGPHRYPLILRDHTDSASIRKYTHARSQHHRRCERRPTRIKLQLGGQPVSIGLRVRENLELLHRNGIGVCLKDTGRSGLDDLLTTPFAFVKLDEAALFAMGLSSRLNAFFRLVLSFFSQFDTTVIARNVVSPEHVLYLESHDIEYVQGPGVLSPMLDKDFIAHLDAQRGRY